MKQLFAYNDTPIESPTNPDSIRDPHGDDNEEFELVMETCNNEPFENTFSQELARIVTLPEPQKHPQRKLPNGIK